MNIEEANEVLKELDEVSPKILDDKAKRLFEAIMKIADERDKAKSDLYEANNCISDLLDIIKEKDRAIENLTEHVKGYSGLAKQIEHDYREQREEVINNDR